MQKDLVHLNEKGFSVVAMTIIGLPYDTEESIMTLADWVTQHSRYQTANLLTPLPATSNWDLKPLNAQGDPLQEGEDAALRALHRPPVRPTKTTAGAWPRAASCSTSTVSKLTSIDALYGRIFRILGNYRLRQARSVQDLSETTETHAQLVPPGGAGRQGTRREYLNQRVTETGRHPAFRQPAPVQHGLRLHG